MDRNRQFRGGLNFGLVARFTLSLCFGLFPGFGIIAATFFYLFCTMVLSQGWFLASRDPSAPSLLNTRWNFSEALLPAGIKDALHLTQSVLHYQPLFKSALLKFFCISVSHSPAQVCTWILSKVSSGLILCHGLSQARGASVYSQIFPILKPENSNFVLVKTVDKTCLL